MLFVIHAIDKPGSLPLRIEHYDDHKSYLAATSHGPVKTVMSGPLVEDDGGTMMGSMFVVEARSRAEVEAFHRNDPFYKAQLWGPASIFAYIKRVG